MDKSVIELFASSEGEDVYRRILATVERYGMEDLISSGILIALSGGADSVLLSLFVYEYKRRTKKEFRVLACHINHMIRGADADSDEEYSAQLAASLGFEFVSRRVDVPAIARANGEGIELAARNARYSAFDEIIQGRDDIACIATAHNATDNAETVIFNLVRGGGTNAAGGIAPVRGSIVRPLISVSKSEILSLLDKHNIDYAVDKTNFSLEYTRNYIRHEILPKLGKINPRFEASFRAFSDFSRIDNEYIWEEAERVLSTIGESVENKVLSALHPAVLSRVLLGWAHRYLSRSLESKHIKLIAEGISRDNFGISIGMGYDFICERGICSIRQCDRDLPSSDYNLALLVGENHISGYRAVVTIVGNEKSSPFINNNSIKADLSSAIISGDLYLRFRRDGDAYRYGGMTRRLKKIFNDLGILPSHRDLIPVICDDRGIVWVPGLGVRDDCPRGEGFPYTIIISRPPDTDGADIYFAHKETD